MVRADARSARPVALLAVLLAATTIARADVPIIASGSRYVVVPPRVRPRSLRPFAFDGPLPERPWSHNEIVHLPRAVASRVLARADGSLVVGTAEPALAWIAPDGRVGPSAVLPSRPINEAPAEGLAGRIFIALGGPNQIATVAPDGTVRHTVESSVPFVRGPVVRDDGGVVVVTQGTGSADVLFLSPEGELRGRRTDPRAGTGTAIGPLDVWPIADRCVWMLTAAGTTCIADDDTMVDEPLGRGDRWLVVLTSGRRVTRSMDLQHPDFHLSTNDRERPLAVTFSDARIVAPTPAGGMAIEHEVPTPEVAIFAADGSLVVRAALTHGASTMSVLVDPGGAFMTTGTDGVLTAYDAAGLPRWSMPAGGTPAVPPVPIATGGIAVVTTDGQLHRIW